MTAVRSNMTTCRMCPSILIHMGHVHKKKHLDYDFVMTLKFVISCLHSTPTYVVRREDYAKFLVPGVLRKW